ncbi:hypothetical protein FRB99_006371 [Tulasnella sp. 403]|nr:hypothetical protein FRB99_006371 [Tulasnella sp. 403]
MPLKTYKFHRPLKRPNEYYKHYDKLMDEQDDKMLKIMNSNLDILLIFAALFSGVNGAFIAITLTLLTPDSTDTTNALLHFLIQRLDNSTAIPHNIYPSTPFSGSTRVNCYFCASLACSLIAALGAIIGKQWLIYYDRTGDVDVFQPQGSWRSLGTEHRGRERLRKLRGLQRWQLRVILEAILPIVLQIAVLVFLVGLIDFTRSVQAVIGWVTFGIVAIGFIAYGATVGAALRDPDCPFQTPVSTFIIPHLFSALLTSSRHVSMVVGRFVQCNVVQLTRWLPFPHRLSGGGTSKPAVAVYDAYAPSTDDIETVSWILSTSMDPSALRSAAASLPHLHVPSVLTTHYIEPSAVSRLEFLFRDAVGAYNSAPSPSSQADIVSYGDAMLHLSLASYVESHAFPTRAGLPDWWEAYRSRVMEAMAANIHSGSLQELYDYYSFVKSISALRDGFGGWRMRFEGDEKRSVPLLLAARLAMLVVKVPHFPGRPIVQFVWPCLDVYNRKDGDDEVSDEIQSLPWNVLNLAAWAVGTFQPETIVDPARAGPMLMDVWNAYTSDQLLLENIDRAIDAYDAHTSLGFPHDMIDSIYSHLLQGFRGFVEDINLHYEDPLHVQVGKTAGRFSLTVSTIIISRLSLGQEAYLRKRRITMLRYALHLACAAYPIWGDVAVLRPLLDGLWKIFLSESTDAVTRESVTSILSIAHQETAVILTEGFSVFDRFPEAIPRLLETLKRDSDTLCLHTLEIISQAIRSASDRYDRKLGDICDKLYEHGYPGILPGLVKKFSSSPHQGKFAKCICSVARDLRRFPPVDRRKWMLCAAQAFHDEAVATPMCPACVAMALVVMALYMESSSSDAPPDPVAPNLQSSNMDPEQETIEAEPKLDWLSGHMVQVVIEYLCVTAKGDNPWENGYVVKAIDRYQTALLADDLAPIRERFQKVYQFWRRGHMENARVVGLGGNGPNQEDAESPEG